MFGTFMNVFSVSLLKISHVVIADLLDEGVLVRGAFAEKLFRQPVNKPASVIATHDIAMFSRTSPSVASFCR
jgi:hypothetical protein